MKRLRSEEGATMVEYGFLLVGIALVVVVGATALGIGAADFYESVAGWF
jgi:Flp pilus assembly pilin Flp